MFPHETACFPLVRDELILKAWTIQRWNRWNSSSIGAHFRWHKGPQWRLSNFSSERKLFLISDIMLQRLYFVKSSHFLDDRAFGKRGCLSISFIFDHCNIFCFLMLTLSPKFIFNHCLSCHKNNWGNHVLKGGFYFHFDSFPLYSCQREMSSWCILKNFRDDNNERKKCWEIVIGTHPVIKCKSLFNCFIKLYLDINLKWNLKSIMLS